LIDDHCSDQRQVMRPATPEEIALVGHTHAEWERSLSIAPGLLQGRIRKALSLS